MSSSTGSSEKNGSRKTVVVQLPGEREFVWPSPRPDMVSWQIGERVMYMGRRWRVVSRENGSSDALTLQLAPDAERAGRLNVD
jgi:hypothetical protein